MAQKRVQRNVTPSFLRRTLNQFSVRIVLSRQSGEMLAWLAAKGIYGSTIDEVAGRFVDAALQRFDVAVQHGEPRGENKGADKPSPTPIKRLDYTKVPRWDVRRLQVAVTTAGGERVRYVVEPSSRNHPFPFDVRYFKTEAEAQQVAGDLNRTALRAAARAAAVGAPPAVTD